MPPITKDKGDGKDFLRDLSGKRILIICGEIYQSTGIFEQGRIIFYLPKDENRAVGGKKTVLKGRVRKD